MRRKKKPSVGAADRPHSHHRSRGGDLFFCFSSRPSAATAPSSSSSAAEAMRAPSSKSLLSPGRGREPAAGPSLSSSLSRRLRSSGSVKGGQSPMFPAVVGGRRKGVAFEAAEPSSPKVTCIGQVRVKSKKKKKKKAAAAKGKASVMRSRSMRGSGREASFRRAEDVGGPRECLPSRNQRWVHQLPVSICEALRAFGSEFNCFFPCGGRSLCSSSSSSRSVEGREGECGEKRSNSCGAVFARWLMAVPESEEGKRREVVGVVVEDRRDREMGVVIKERIKREALELEVETHMSEEVLMVVDKGEEKGEEKEEEEEARVSICIPPSNALLLMRCRSDPVRMAALASRFWDSPAMQVRVEEEEDGDNENRDQRGECNEEVEGEEWNEEAAETEQAYQEEEGVEESHKRVVLTEELMKKSDDGRQAKEEEMELNPDEEKQNKDEELIEGTAAVPVETIGNAGRDQEEREIAASEADNGQLEEKAEQKEMTNKTHLEDREDQKEEEKGRRSSSCSSTVDKEERRSNRHASRPKDGGRRRSSASRERDRRRHSFSTDREVGRPSVGSEKEARRASFSIEGKGRWSFSIEKDGLRLESKVIDEEKKTIKEYSTEEKGPKVNIEVQNSYSTEKEEELKEEEVGDREQRRVECEAGEKREEKKSTELPDCLLLMMYEPKLSMEVSKETWVCSNDFLRWRVHHPNYGPRHPSKSAAAAAAGATTITTTTTSGIDTGSTRVDEVTKGEVSKADTDDKSGENKEAVAPIQETPQPPPPAPPTASDTEKKPRGNAAVPPTPAPAPAYGPFVLTRCKSEPMRSSARLAPDACFWKDRHRPIGATGIGF